jgi:hypothetical protein
VIQLTEHFRLHPITKTVLLFGALILQATALLLVVRRLQGNSTRCVGFLFLAVSFLYHGLTEIIALCLPGENKYRLLLSSDSDTTEFAALVGAAFLVFAIAYTVAVDKLVMRPVHFSRNCSTVVASWQVITFVTLPLYLFVRLAPDAWSGTYWILGLSDQFSSILLALGAAGILIRRKGKSALLILGCLCLLFIWSNSRLQAVASLAACVWSLQYAGVRIASRLKLEAAALAVFSLLFVPVIRQTSGRFLQGEDWSQRVRMVANSIVSADAVNWHSYTADFASRFDGNSFGALVLQRIAAGSPPIGVRALIVTCKYMVPRFLFPDKLDLDITERSDKGFIAHYYGLPDHIDWLATMWSTAAAYYGWPSLLVFAVLGGFGFAKLDSVLFRSRSNRLYIVGVIAVICAVMSEQGVGIYLGSARACIVLYSIQYGASWFATRKHYHGTRGRVSQTRTPRLSKSTVQMHLRQETTDQLGRTLTTQARN